MFQGPPLLAGDPPPPPVPVSLSGVDVVARTGEPLQGVALARTPVDVVRGAYLDAQIDYGDGTPSEFGRLDGHASPSGVYFTINSLGHAYAHAGVYAVQIAAEINGLAATTTTTVTVTDDADVPDRTIRATGLDIAAVAGEPTYAPLARFSSPTLGEYSRIMIDYGDYTPVALGPWLETAPYFGADSRVDIINGQGHVYAAPGTYTVRVTFILDDMVGVATSTATVSAAAAPAPGDLGGEGSESQAPAGNETTVEAATAPAELSAKAPAVAPWMASFLARLEAGNLLLRPAGATHPAGPLAQRSGAPTGAHRRGAGLNLGHHPVRRGMALMARNHQGGGLPVA